MKTWVTLLVTGLVIGIGALCAAAEVGNHPVIKPVPGSVQSSTPKYSNFDAYTFKYTDNGQRVEKTVKGKFWEFHYEYLTADGARDNSRSALETVENFKQAALEKGGTILGERKHELIFTLDTENTKIWSHVYCNNWNGYYQLRIIEEEVFKKTLTFGAEEMKRELDARGQVSIYGINFDFDKSTLKLESEKVLIEMVKLMKSNPGLRIEIQGHTDSQGTAEYNLELSDRRAGTVKAFLLLYGIDQSRMTTRGFGMSVPVASNETEEGRAKNRRVELKKL